MNKRLFLATIAAAIATSAFAQSSPSTSSSNPSATQRQQDSTSSTSPSSSTTSPSSSSGSAQSNPSTNSAQTQSPSSTGQAAAGQSSNSGSGTNTTQAPASNNSTNQAQTSQPSGQTTTPSNQAQTNSPSSTNNQTQSANPPASGANQAQSPTGSGSTNTAQQPNNVNASVNINGQQRTRISASISHLNVQPLTNVNFSLSVGTVVPRDVRLQPLPAEVVEIVPQYRGYNFVLVKDEIVIVEPSTYKIVTVLPYSGRSTAAAPTRTEQRKVMFSDRDREVVRKHAKARPVEREKRVTTGSSVRTEIRTGERVPEGVEIEAFPEEVYRDAPTLREYRYINRDSRTYIVEPHERRIIEEID